MLLSSPCLGVSGNLRLIAFNATRGFGMSRVGWYVFGFMCSVFVFSAPAFAVPFADLNCDDAVNVLDVQLAVLVALDLPMGEGLDENQDGTPDACPPGLSCGNGTQLNEAETECVGIWTQADVDAAYLAGAESVDLTTDNQESYEAGLAAAGGCDLSGGSLNGAYLPGAKFNNANLNAVDLTDVILSGASLVGASLTGATLFSTYLGGADLSGANLTAGNLTNAYLGGANLTGAILVNATLYDTYLGGVNFSGADLTNVLWSNTFCPDGSNSNNNGGTCCGHLYGAVPAAECDEPQPAPSPLHFSRRF